MGRAGRVLFRADVRIVGWSCNRCPDRSLGFRTISPLARIMHHLPRFLDARHSCLLHAHDVDPSGLDRCASTRHGRAGVPAESQRAPYASASTRQCGIRAGPDWRSRSGMSRDGGGGQNCRMAGSRVKGPVIGPMVFAENSRLQHGAGLHWLN